MYKTIMLRRLSFGKDSQNALNELLEAGTSSLEQVLSHQALGQAIRCSNSKFVYYITTEENLNRVFDWVLTLKFHEHEDYTKLSRSALSVLISNSNLLQQTIFSSHVFLDRIKEFQESNEFTNTLLAGYYEHIIEQVFRFKTQKILEDLPNLGNLLIENIHVIAYRELLVFLINETQNINFLTPDLMDSLVKKVSSESGYSAIMTIHRVLKSKSKIISQFKTPSVLKAFLETASQSGSNLLITEIFHSLNIIYDGSFSDEEKSIVSEYSSKFDFVHDTKCYFAPAVLFFNNLTIDIANHLFDSPSDTFLNQAIYQLIMKMNDEKFNQFINSEPSFKMNLINAVKNSLINGHATQIANRVNDNSSEWIQFKDEFLSPKNEILNKQYVDTDYTDTDSDLSSSSGEIFAEEEDEIKDIQHPMHQFECIDEEEDEEDTTAKSKEQVINQSNDEEEDDYLDVVPRRLSGADESDLKQDNSNLSDDEEENDEEESRDASASLDKLDIL